MNDEIKRALQQDRTIDITTTGRKSGQPRRIEIWFHYVEGRIFITGMPGTRSWYANLLGDPQMTFHLKGSAKADIPAKARPITADAERREILPKIFEKMGRNTAELEDWAARSPLVEVELEA